MVASGNNEYSICLSGLVNNIFVDRAIKGKATGKVNFFMITESATTVLLSRFRVQILAQLSHAKYNFFQNRMK